MSSNKSPIFSSNGIPVAFNYIYAEKSQQEFLFTTVLYKVWYGQPRYVVIKVFLFARFFSE